MKKLLPLLLLILIGCSENQEKWISTSQFSSGDLIEQNNTVYEKDYGITKQSFLLKPYSGKYKKRHMDYIEEGNIVNGSKTGKLIHKDYSGNLIMEGPNYRVYKNGSYKWYFQNGQVRVEGNYKYGKKNGYFTYYYKTGEIEMEGEYQNDLQEGKWGIFYRNGQKKGELIYENGVEQTSLILKSLDSIY